MLADDGLAAHVGDQGVGDADGAVGLLVVFKKGEIGAADRKAGAVEGVDKLAFFGAFGLVADVGAASLEGLEIGAGTDLAIGVLAGYPDLQVVGFGRTEAHVACAEQGAAVRQAEAFEDDLSVAGEGFVLGGGVFGAGELDEFYLLKLVLADHAADVLAVAAGFGAEAGGPGAKAQGAGAEVEGFVAEEVGDGDLGGGDEPVVVILGRAGLVRAFVVAVKELVGELGQLAGAEEGARVDDGGRQDLRVAMFAGMEVEHEVGEGAFEAGAGAEMHDEAGAGNFGGALEVEDAQGFADLPMGFRGEGKVRDFAPGHFTDVVVLGAADGDAVLGQVGQGFEQGTEPEVERGGSGFERVGPGFQVGRLGADRRGVGAGTLEAAELLGERVALRFQGLGFGDRGAAVGVELGKTLDQGGVCSAGAKFFRDKREIGTQKAEVEHGQLHFIVPIAARCRWPLESRAMSDVKRIGRVLLSVTDKTGVVEFARVLAEGGAELVSTGGTAQVLREAGLPVRDVAELTGFPEMLDGRVKTLHPLVHGGLLHRRGDPAHVAAVEAHGIAPLDMVVVNLYAFEKTAAKPGVSLPELIENIDIGGPSMLRSAAKNYEDVAVVSSAGQYRALTAELQKRGGLSTETRWELARAAFATTAAYDAAIASTLEARAAAAGGQESAVSLPETLRLTAPRKTVLRYGENPHQSAALYTDGSTVGVANAEQLQGKELSYNNLVDLDACWALASEFDATAVAIIKHTNPCGVGLGTTVAEAYARALAADPISAFGGVIGINRTVDGAAAAEIAKLFVEAIVAPGFTDEALQIFAAKKNLRLLQLQAAKTGVVLRSISGGYLLQSEDAGVPELEALRTVTEREPTAAEREALRFAWAVSKHVKSNAVVYARLDGGFGQTVGVGAGQMSRVDAARFGAIKAALPLGGCVAASDAFFPFPDGLEAVAQAGATAVIQPGGSVRDPEVIAAANRLGVAMLYTGVRHFRHG